MCMVRTWIMITLTGVCIGACEGRKHTSTACDAHGASSERTVQHKDNHRRSASTAPADATTAIESAFMEEALACLQGAHGGKNPNLCMYEQALASARAANSTNVAWLEQALAYFSNIMTDIELLSPVELSRLSPDATIAYADTLASKCLARQLADDKNGMELYSRYLIDNDLIDVVAPSNAIDVLFIRSGLKTWINREDRETCLKEALRIAEQSGSPELLVSAYWTLSTLRGDYSLLEKAYALAQSNPQIDEDTRQSVYIELINEKHSTSSAKANALRGMLPSLNPSLPSYQHAQRLYNYYAQQAENEQ